MQKENLTAVNDAVNELCVDDEDYDALRSSINDFDNFDHIALAQKVEKHELLEFRRIAATIYKKHKRWEQSIRLSKADKMYKDAIDTCSASGDPALAEDLLRFFVDVCDKECFCATLYTCYKIVTPDVALELAWRSTYVDFAMPYVIQYARHLHDTIAELAIEGPRFLPHTDEGSATKEKFTELLRMMLSVGALTAALIDTGNATGNVGDGLDVGQRAAGVVQVMRRTYHDGGLAFRGNNSTSSYGLYFANRYAHRVYTQTVPFDEGSSRIVVGTDLPQRAEETYKIGATAKNQLLEYRKTFESDSASLRDKATAIGGQTLLAATEAFKQALSKATSAASQGLEVVKVAANVALKATGYGLFPTVHDLREGWVKVQYYQFLLSGHGTRHESGS